jgi:hypothetical protein
MKNVYAILGGIVACGVIVGLVYILGHTRGVSAERDRCQAAQIAVVEKIEEKRQTVRALVDSADDIGIMRMLCAGYARGGCKWPDNISDGLRDIQPLPADAGKQTPDPGK